jgi:hypothetical protein
MAAMDTTAFNCIETRDVLRGLAAALLLGALGTATAVRAAGPSAASAPSKPLDLTLPREAGQWTGVASRVQEQERLEAGPGPQAERRLNLRVRQQPYGTGYEARMSAGMGGAAAAGPATGGAGGPAGAGAAAPGRGGGRGR